LQTLAYWVFDSALSHGASLGDFLLAPVCPTEKIALREDLLYLTSASETECYPIGAYTYSIHQSDQIL